MNDDRQDNGGLGEQLGARAAEYTEEKARLICQCERGRIERHNEPLIAARCAEAHSLRLRVDELEERIRQAPPPGDLRARRRRARYYRTVAAVLLVVGFFSALIALAPFRLGWMVLVICVGLAVMTPFVVDEFMILWNRPGLFKAVATVAFVASLVTLILLGAIRGQVLAEYVRTVEQSVVIDGDNAAPEPPHSSFYEETLVPLRIALALLALAIELSAGLALSRVRSLLLDSPDDAERLREERDEVNQLIIALIALVGALRSQPDEFENQFWRDYHIALMFGTVQNAVRKLSKPMFCLSLLAALVAAPHPAEAAEPVNLVLLLDLSKSVAVAGHDGKTEFAKNTEAITAVLAKTAAGSHVSVLGITDDSFAQPDVLLSADISADEGYFGEKLADAHRKLLVAWQQRTSQLEAKCPGTDILGALLLAGQVFESLPKGRKNELIVFSDMRQSTKDLNLEVRGKLDPDAALRQIERSHLVADLHGVEVHLLGVDNADRQINFWLQLKAFWASYFAHSRTRLVEYSTLRR